MAVYSIYYNIYLTAGHHRQPRNSPSVDTVFTSSVTYSGTANIPPPQYIPHFDSPMKADLIFWSVSNGVTGTIYPAGPIPGQTADDSGLTITAWYLPEGGDGNGGTAIIDDAFSAALGNFIDDTFVTVTSDPSLTSEANVVGIVPTAKAETLKAYPSVASTGEPFAKWMSFGAGAAVGDTINVPAGSVGMAIALYQSPPPIQRPHVTGSIYGTLIGGVAVDGGGKIVINGIPHPVDPWGPLVIKLVNASLVTAGSRTMGGGGKQVRQIAARSVVSDIREALRSIEKEAEGGGE